MPRKRKLQRDLIESERNFRLLVEGVTDYALYMLTPDGIVSSWNAGGQHIKGYKADEIIGQSFAKFYSEADRAAGRPDRSLRIALETGRYEEEGWRVRKDGSFFWASVVIDPIRSEDGELIGYAKVTRDITERREAELKLQKVQRQLAESQKMDALGQLTGGVAHDFNNLLMIISGSVHTLRKYLADEKALRALHAIEIASQRGAALTRQLLTFARRQNLNPVSVSVLEHIRGIEEVLKSGLGNSASLKLNLFEETWPVRVDMGELETALVNLVINARDAMPKGGSVVVGTENVQRGDDEFVAISVTDTGQGIPEDVLSRVFDPFFTTKPVGKGTGLGLSQVHGFAHQAGGTVELKSKLGEGTTVTILLPRAAIPEQGEQAETNESTSGTVLLVEDNPDVAAVSTSLLEQLGYAVRRAADADAALQELNVDEIDLVFSDIVMPGKMDGLALARAIREKYPSIPILLTTGYSETARRTSEFPVLRKPYQIHELSRELAKLLRPVKVA